MNPGNLRETLLANWRIEFQPELTDAPTELDCERLTETRSRLGACHLPIGPESTKVVYRQLPGQLGGEQPQRP